MSYSPGHLIRRWWGTVRAEPLNADEESWVRSRLLVGEWDLWSGMDWRDQRHSYRVARDVADTGGDEEAPPRSVIAAALLHDVGKTVSRLSTAERVLATIVGGRTRRFRQYLDHEAIGVDLCRRAGSDPETLTLLAGNGDPAQLRRIRRADER